MHAFVVCPIATGGGISESFINGTAMLIEQGFDVSVAIPKGFALARRLDRKIRSVTEIPLLQAGGVALLPYQIGALTLAFRSSGADLLVLNNGRFLRGLKRSTRKPIVTVFHGGKPGRVVGSDRVITVNEDLVQDLVGSGIAPERVALVDNVLPEDCIRPPRAWQRRTEPCLGTLRLLEPAKGIDILIEAMQILARTARPLRLKIGGTGGQDRRLRTMVKERSLEHCVEFVGWVQDKSRFLDEIDLYVLPSRTEEWGIAVVEAQAASLPVIATDCAGPKRLIRHGETGWLVPREDPRALADAILHVIADDELASRMASRGREFCMARFSQDVISPRYAREIRRVLD